MTSKLSFKLSFKQRPVKGSVLLSGAVSCVLLAACAGDYNDGKSLEGAQYWQRVSASEAVYTRGPKAQQMLNSDIASCVAETRELVRLGAIREALNTDSTGRVLDPDQREIVKWDSPEHDRYLRTEHTPYHDFEGCMMANGWERTKYVPYAVADQSRDDYLKAHVDYEYKSRKRDNDRQDPNMIPLNE